MIARRWSPRLYSLRGFHASTRLFPRQRGDARSRPPPASISNPHTVETHQVEVLPRRILTEWPKSSEFASYTVGLPPTDAQLVYANRYFETTRPSFLSSAAKFRTLPVSDVPEVVFLGRSNVGKSSLLNALLNRSKSQIAHVSKRPGHTKLMNAYGVGAVKVVSSGQHENWHARGGVVVMDTPGYGKASQAEWGKEIVKYLTARKQLRRTFVLIDSEHGVKDTDMQLLQLLWHNRVPYQVVMSKVDKVIVPQGKMSLEALGRNMERLPEVFEAARDIGERQQGAPRMDVITCSSEMGLPSDSGSAKIGIDNLRWAVLCAAGLDCDEQGRRRWHLQPDAKMPRE